MKVLGYVRVSTDQQGDDGVSLEAQRARIEAFATAKGVELVDVVQDVASAKSLDRPGWRSVRARLEAREADGLIVAKLDRLTRSVRDWGELVETLFRSPDRGGRALMSVADSVDTSTSAGRMFLNILTTIAQWERERIGENTRDALAHLKAQGVKWGQAPYGMRWSHDVDAQGHKRLLVDEGELAVVRIIVAASKQITHVRKKREQPNAHAIASWLNEKGYRLRKGTQWSARTVLRVLARSNELFALAGSVPQSQSQEEVNA